MVEDGKGKPLVWDFRLMTDDGILALLNELFQECGRRELTFAYYCKDCGVKVDG